MVVLYTALVTNPVMGAVVPVRITSTTAAVDLLNRVIWLRVCDDPVKGG